MKTAWMTLLMVLAMAAHGEPPSLLGVGAMVGRPGLPSRGFVTGFNQAWLRNDYGHDWIRSFDADEYTRLIRMCRALSGSVLRVWIFQDPALEGVLWDGAGEADPPALERTRTRPTGFSAVKLAHVERVLEIAEREGVKLYVTLFNGAASALNPRDGARRDEWYNLLNDRYGAGEGFRAHVLAPLCAVMARHREAVLAVDLMNELNALVPSGPFERGWTGAQRFVETWRAAIRAQVDVPVGASYGWGATLDDLVGMSLPPASVDFYDVHVYGDRGRIPRPAAVELFIRSCGRPVYLGEFGQETLEPDPELQARVTEGFLRDAQRLGFAGAFAWRLSEPGRSVFSYEDGGRLRPAAERFRAVSLELGAAPAQPSEGGLRP